MSITPIFAGVERVLVLTPAHSGVLLVRISTSCDSALITSVESLVPLHSTMSSSKVDSSRAAGQEVPKRKRVTKACLNCAKSRRKVCLIVTYLEQNFSLRSTTVRRHPAYL